MKELVFIIPYFGKFNNYFQLFLNSCKNNKNVDWIIYTDDKTKYDYPENIKIKYITFEEMKKKVQKKIEFLIKLEKPYKLCDYKAIYGIIFEEEIRKYKYWGHCDVDLIWGNIEKLIFPLLEKEEYDKLFFLGHCSIYKNDIKNIAFLKEMLLKNIRMREVYQNERNFSFDEEFNKSINNIFIVNNKKIYLKELEANIYMKSTFFKLTKYNFELKKYIIENKKEFIIIYNFGNLEGYYLEKGKLKKDEYLYIHMQSRKMKIKEKNLNENFFKIIPNFFENLEFNEITIENIKKIKKRKYNLHYLKLRSKNLYLKTKKLLISFKEKKCYF